MKLPIFNRLRRTSCESLWTLISAYADGEATAAESKRVESHIADCERCASALSLIQNTSVKLSAVSPVEPPPHLRAAVLAATTALDASTGKLRPTRRPMRLQWGFGAAALAGVLAALVFHANQPPDVPLITPPNREIVREPVDPPSSVVTPSAPESNDLRETPQAMAQNTARSEPDSAQTSDVASLRPAGIRAPTTNVPDLGARVQVADKTPAVSNKIKAATPGAVLKPKVDTPMAVVENTPMAPMDMNPEPAAPKIDMAVMSTPMPMVMAPAANPEPSNPAPSEPITRKIVLVAEPKALPAGQVSSLADLKKSLRQQSIQWNRPEAMRGLNGKQISVEIVKRSF